MDDTRILALTLLTNATRISNCRVIAAEADLGQAGDRRPGRSSDRRPAAPGASDASIRPNWPLRVGRRSRWPRPKSLLTSTSPPGAGIRHRHGIGNTPQSGLSRPRSRQQVGEFGCLLRLVEVVDQLQGVLDAVRGQPGLRHQCAEFRLHITPFDASRG